MQAREGKIELARHTLGPVATNPHGGNMASEAQRFIDQMEGVPEGTEWSPRPVLDLAEAIVASPSDDNAEDDF